MRAAPAARGLAALLVAAAALLACSASSVLERAPVAKQRFTLQVPPPAPVAGPRAGVLRVALVRVAPPFQNRGFVLRTGDDTYASDFYNEFASPPGALLRDVLVAWLRDGSRFASVARSSEAPPDWVLETEIDSLYADVRDPAAPRVEIALTARLLDARAKGDPIRLEKRYAESESAADRAPGALAAAWSRALGRILPALAADLDAAAARR